VPDKSQEKETTMKSIAMTAISALVLAARKSLTRAAWIAVALAAFVLTSSGPAMASGKPAPNDPIVLLLKGIYQPVVNGPNLGLPGVNLNDGTWITTQIHSVTTVPGSSNQNNSVTGNFYSQTTSALVAYSLPGGAILMEFTAGSFAENPPIPDGQGGVYLQETWELTILQATGIYAPYAGGHNHMVDRFHSLANGQFDESCFCIISVAESLPLWWSSN
jgi:hypothetical protein